MTTKVSPTEAAKIAGVCRKTILRRIADGSLPAAKFGPRLLRIDVADLEALYQPVGGAADVADLDATLQPVGGAAA